MGRRLYKHVCEICGKEFQSTSFRAKYCTMGCRNSHISVAMAERIKKGQGTGKCAWCGNEFTMKVGNQICCSKECAHEYQKVKARVYMNKVKGYRNDDFDDVLKKETEKKKQKISPVQRLKHQQDQNVWGHNPGEYAEWQKAKTLAMLPKIGEKR